MGSHRKEGSKAPQSAVGALGASGGAKSTGKSLQKLRDSFMGRVPAQQRVASLKLVWQELWSKAVQYMDSGELAELGEAFVFAADAHDGQWRSSGDPYTTHTISVTTILAEMQLEREVLLAAILHDILEDTAVPKERLAEKFGDHVAVLVDGVTKLGKLPFKSIEDYQAENLRKMFIVMAKDIRVVLIKLADRVHNMRTLQSLRRDKQLRIAKETLEIYAPLAHRLGIYQIKRELEDLAFKIQDPDMYYEIRRRVRKKLPEREAVVKDAINALQERVKSSDIDIYITGRAKHFFSIFEKMQRKNLSLEQVYDLLAVRVIVSTITECYTVLGTVHTLWKPIPGQFDDYIANPKNNMYQSLHTTVVGPSGEPLEVQIRTWEMHQIAEYGIAAHWQYKEKRNKTDELDQRLTWVRQALEEQSDAEEPSSFLEHLKEDVLTSEVFVFTPQGDVVNLPNGSTPIDFAYSIHTEVGHKCVGAMVNGRIVSMDYTLQNGDIVRVLTSPQGHPSRDWLKVVRSNRARSKIRSYFRQKERAERERRVSRGRELIDRELRKKGYEGSGAVEDYKGQMNRAARDYGFAHADELLAEIGSGNRNPEAVASKVVQKSRKPAQPEELPETRTPEHKREFDSEIAVEGDEGVLVSIANCCRPVPGDPIVGYVTKNRGITVHHVHCGNIKNAARDRLVNVSWGNRVAHSYPARINVEAGDRPTLFADISQAINAAEASIVGVRASVKGANRAVMTAEIQVRDLEHLYHVIAKVNAVPGVMQVVRG